MGRPPGGELSGLLVVLLFGIALRVSASAVVLPVQIVFGGKLYGTLVAALLLEIAREPLDSEDVALLLCHFVEHLGVFHGADGERGGEVFGAQFLGEPGRFGEAKFEALAAALAAFGFVFEAAHCVVELLWVIFTLDKGDRMLCLNISFMGKKKENTKLPDSSSTK